MMRQKDSADVVICGAGIAGISAAYHLAVGQGIRNVLLVDERDPFSLTSDKSTECYRNWWPGPDNAMVALMNRSIDLLEALAEDSGNSFHLNRRGYLYLTAAPKKIPAMRAEAEEISRLGGGPLRVHSGLAGDPVFWPSLADGFDKDISGADLILDQSLLRQHYPYITKDAVAGLHVRRAGWFSAQQLGMLLLERAIGCGVRLENARVSAVEQRAGRVQAIQFEDGRRISTPIIINAAGPFLKATGQLMEVELPVFCELHQKIAINDPAGAVPREAPLLIWTDPQRLQWSEDERELLAEDDSAHGLLDELPAGAHLRPEGGPDSPVVLMLWEYHTPVMEPVWPPPLDPQVPEVVLRGLTTMLPGLQTYISRLPRPHLDGGYYTKTIENRPLIGPLPIQGAFVIGALSGFGLMAGCAAGELVALQVSGAELPSYAPAFRLDRYEDPTYQGFLASCTASGQI
jgi:glycine/D-amino acid oxidase-like deaminating enzyme